MKEVVRMITRTEFVRLFGQRYLGGADGTASSAGVKVEAVTFVRSLGSREAMAAFIAEMSRSIHLSVPENEVLEYLSSGNYNVADMYDFLLEKRSVHRGRAANRYYMGLTVLFGLLAVYGLFQANAVIAMLASAAGSSIYAYRFNRGRGSAS
jgi:hypothetical protein